MADSTNTPAEVWRAIPNFTDYSVSSTGRVMRTAGGKGAKPMRIIKQSKDQGGRLVFNASMSGKVKQLKVHRAVAFAFIGPCPEGHEVAHLDGNQENNCVVNLSYSTPVENTGISERTALSQWAAIYTAQSYANQMWPQFAGNILKSHMRFWQKNMA